MDTDQTDEQLLQQREELTADIEKGTNGRITDKLGLLLEIERELTLRE